MLYQSGVDAMNIVIGSFLDSLDFSNHVFCATTCGMIKKNGELVMGKGSALELVRYNNLLPSLFAKEITKHENDERGFYKYGFVSVECDGIRYGAFQTKLNPFEDSSESLIEFSCWRLYEWLDQNEGIVHIPFPGIGNGNLKRENVEFILDSILYSFSDRIKIYCRQGNPFKAGK